MVNIKNTIAGLCLLAATVSAANIHNEKRHAHHRRHHKRACTASGTGSYPKTNSTQSVNKAISTSSVASVITVSVVPVPVNPTPSEPASSETASPIVGPSQPAGSQCGVATSYVTVQKTVTVTAGDIPSSSSTTTSSSTPGSTSTPSTTSSSSSTSISAATKVKAPSPVVSAIIKTPVPISQPSTSTTVAPSAGALLQASSSASPAPAATPTVSQSTNVGYSGGKMGMSWIPGGPWSDLKISNIPWVYDWGQVANGVPNGVEYIPTLHDGGKCADFASQLAKQPNVHYVKHFNEPDMYGYGGSGMTPSEAAGLHKQYISGLAGKYALGFPAVTSNNNGMSGTNWFTAFAQQTGCGDFSFADFHFYGGNEDIATQAKIFLGYVDNWISVVDAACPNKNLPIWITEFSAGPVPGDVGQAHDFMAIAGPALNSNPRVARYSYFFPSNNVLSAAVTAIDQAVHH